MYSVIYAHALPRLEAAPLVKGVAGATYQGYDSETEAFEAFGRARMARENLVLDGDVSDEIPTESTIRPERRERRPENISARADGKAEIRDGSPAEEIVVQCPPISSSQPRTIQRAGTLPAQHPPRSSSNVIQRSRTVPDLDSRSMPSTPKKVRVQKPQVPNVSRSRAVSTSSTEDETIPPSPATGVSITLSPTFGNHFPLSPRDASPPRSSPARKRDRDDGYRHHRTSITRSTRGSKCEGRTGSPSKKATTAGGSLRSTTRGGTNHPPHSLKKGALDSPSQTNRRTPRDTTPSTRGGSRSSVSPCGSLQLTYVSDDGSPSDDSARFAGDTDYYTPSSRDSEASDAESEASRRVLPSISKRKGKNRASPPPPSPYPHSSPSSHVGNSPRNPNCVAGRSRRRRRDRYVTPSNDMGCHGTREQAPVQEPSQSAVQDVCHCAGPCPSCHKHRLPVPPNYRPMMFQPVQYSYFGFPPPHMQLGYQMPHYGFPPNIYSFPTPQHPDPLLPSISSAQPIPSGYPILPPPATHLPAAHPPNVPAYASPPPSPTASLPAPEPSTSPLTHSPPVHVGSPLPDPPVIQQVSPELIEALGQFSQPSQCSVKVVDPICDPRSPYSKRAVVPSFPNR